MKEIITDHSDIVESMITKLIQAQILPPGSRPPITIQIEDDGEINISYQDTLANLGRHA
jgi:hypothetical protein